MRFALFFECVIARQRLSLLGYFQYVVIAVLMLLKYYCLAYEPGCKVTSIASMLSSQGATTNRDSVYPVRDSYYLAWRRAHLLTVTSINGQ